MVRCTSSSSSSSSSSLLWAPRRTVIRIGMTLLLFNSILSWESTLSAATPSPILFDVFSRLAESTTTTTVASNLGSKQNSNLGSGTGIKTGIGAGTGSKRGGSTLFVPVQRLVNPTTLTPTTTATRALAYHQKHRRALEASLLSSSSSSRAIAVHPIAQVGYAGEIMIGTPPQRFPVLFDTGSDLALVLSDRCQGSVECQQLAKFSCAHSSTCVDLNESSAKDDDDDDHDDDHGDNSASTVVTATSVKSTREGSRLGDASVTRNLSKDKIEDKDRDSQRRDGQSFQKDHKGTFDHSTHRDSDKLKKSNILSNKEPRTKFSPGNGNHVQSARRRFQRRQQSLGVIGPGASKIEKGLYPISEEQLYGTGGHVQDDSRTSSRDGVSPGSKASDINQTLWPLYYNQTYVDGSWGAGTFVQDRIIIDPSTEPTTMTATTPSTLVSDPETSPSIQQSSSNGHTARVTFLNVVQDHLDLFQGYSGHVSGLLGLTRASPSGRKTFLQELVNQGSLNQPIVSMHLEDEGGSFLLGGMDPSQYSGKVWYSPVTDPVSWQISLQGLALRPRPPPEPPATSDPRDENNDSNCKKNDAWSGTEMLPGQPLFQGAALVLDSGTSSLLIPTAASEVIHRALGGTWDSLHQVWFLPCQGPDLVWWLSAGHGVIQPYETLVYHLNDGQCQSLIFGHADSEHWILGDTWLRGLYIVYEMTGQGRVGIASAIDTFRPAGVWSRERGGYVVGDGDDAGRGSGSRRGGLDNRILSVRDKSAAACCRLAAFVHHVGMLFGMILINILFVLAN